MLRFLPVRSAGLLLAVLGLAGCAQLSAPPAATANQPSTAASCAGDIVVPYGLSEVSDDAMLKQTVQAPGKGGLCVGRVFRVQQALAVYRVWDSASPNSQYGRWWSFAPPAGPREAYRNANEICPEWSALNRVTQCRLKVGSEIVLGPGQSAQCANGKLFPPSPANQVFVPNDTRDPDHPKLVVSDCQPDVAWP